MSKRGNHGHHGGAWKVAYADFVTSMMALFLVLWLVSSDQETRDAVQAYFRGEKSGAALKRPGAVHESDAKPFKPKPDDRASKNLATLEKFNRSMERLRDQLNNSSEAGEDLIRFEFLADGVRIVAIDRAKKPFFSPGTAKFTDFGTFVLNTIAWEIERHPYMIEVEGHTQKNAEVNAENNTDHSEGDLAWDLSTLRAMAARKALQGGGVENDQFWRVAGYADRQPINADKPDSEENRRISVVIRPKLDEQLDDIKTLYSNP